MTSYLPKLSSLTNGQSEEAAGEDQNPEIRREDVERSRIGSVRAVVQVQDPSSQDVNDLMICRFLRARDLDVEKAAAMLLRYLKWRKEFVPNGFISPDEIPNEIAQNKLFMQGVDKTGRPIALVFAARHKPTTLEEFKRYVTFTLDTICARMPSDHEKFTAISDLKGWGYANLDLRGYLASLHILQDFYPERLGKIFMIHVPYIFMAAWKMIYPFIDKVTKKKILFVEDKKLLSTLLEDIDESNIPEEYGGKMKLVPIHEC